jgi:zinc protease
MTAPAWWPTLVLTMTIVPPLAGQQPAAAGTITLREPESPFVAFNIWVKAGSQDDPAGKQGLAALTANLLAEGSTTADRYDAILAKLYPMAAGYGYAVDKEMTVFRGRVHRDNLEAYYALFKNALLQPAFSEEDFQRVKTQTVNFLERARRYSRDEELSKELLFWMAYRGTPYEHPEEGYVQSVKSLTLDDVKAFYRDHYVRNTLVVGLGGGYPEGFAERVRGDYDALPTRDVAVVPRPAPAPPAGIKVLIVEKPTDATAISLGFPYSLVRGQPDFFALMAANAWFGEHRNSFSHLYQVIRESRGMNYGDYSYIEAFPLGYTTQEPPVNVARRNHLFEIWIRPIARTGPDDLHDRALFATRAAWRELARLADGGMTDSALQETKDYLHNFSVTYGSTVSRRLAYAVDDAAYGLPSPGFLKSIRPGLAALTRENVNAAVRRHLQHQSMYVVFITQDAEGLKRKLLSGMPTPIRYAGTKSAAHLAEDAEIAKFPIPVKEADITIVGINEVFEK